MIPVPRITCSIEEINSYRRLKIIELLKSVANRGDKIVCNSKSVGGRFFVIGVSDSTEAGTEYSSWRFKTYVDNFFAMYHEKWVPYVDNMYFLERAYFHIYKTKKFTLEEEEYILLHCDVSEPIESPHSIYKQSPHLHIKSAEQPLPHAHLALNNCDLDITLSSLDNLDNALQHSIRMIDNQILLELAK